jgi:TM2 domain-containing membrane protein YozV
MNCANHPERATVAYCRTCGKGLCQECAHSVRGVIYCENCLAAMLEGKQPEAAPPAQTAAAAGFVPPAQAAYSVQGGAPGSGPNPTVAGILAGFFPMGVGAVYCGQYAKGFAHLLILFGLIWGQASTDSDAMHVMLGFALAFFYVYQIIDAVRSAKAVQMGQPAPDPFGLSRTFSSGEKVEAGKIPAGAIVLIGLGCLFLLQTMGVRFFDLDRLWPLFLIGIGGWLFASRYGYIGGGKVYDCERCRSRGLMGPAVLVTLGTLFLLEQYDVIAFHRTWPLLLVVIGLVKVLQGNASTVGHVDGHYPSAPLPPPGPGTPGPTGVATGQVQPPASEVKNG